MKEKINIAVIGAGRIGKMHAENIKSHIPQAEIKIVTDIFADQIKDWANGIGIKNITKDSLAAINDPEVDAVFICSPTDTHSEYILEASRAGKDIFCEKPIDFDIGKIKETIKAVDSSGVKCQIGFHRRFDHNFRRVHDLLRQGKIGEINLLKITSFDPEPPPLEYSKICGGLFVDMTIHDFDMARFLSGSEVTEVFANATVRVDPDIEKVCADYDTAITSLKFENGAIGVIDNCRKAPYGHDQRVEILGSEGTLEVLNDTPSTAILSNDKGVCHEKPMYFFIQRYSGAYIAELNEFFGAITEDRKPSVGMIDGLISVEIAAAAHKSAKEGRPVKLKEISG